MNNSNRVSYFAVLTSFSLGIAFLQGCGGGGGGNDSTPGATATPVGPTPTPTFTPTPGPTPTPLPVTLMGAYDSAIVPSGAVPSDAKTPVQQFQIANTVATTKFTYFVPPSVIKTVQAQINSGLTKAGAAFAIPGNQLPTSIQVTGNGQLDGSGKLVLSVSQTVNVCGTAKLTIDPKFTVNSGEAVGTGTYRIDFPNNLTLNVLGRKISSAGTCNNLPLRTGTLSLTK